jgi:hypothetical protein
MKVSIKNLAVTMEVKNTGMELDVYDNQGNFLGDLVITKSQLIWCRGKVRRKNGKAIKWPAFIKFMEES